MVAKSTKGVKDLVRDQVHRGNNDKIFILQGLTISILEMRRQRWAPPSERSVCRFS